MQYLVVTSKTANNYCAGAPDVPGCVSTGRTPEEMQANIHEALAFHFDGMLENGETLPEPTARTMMVEGYNAIVYRENGEWVAFVEELWPVVVSADTPKRAEALLRQTIPAYLDSLRSYNAPVPPPIAEVFFVDVNLPRLPSPLDTERTPHAIRLPIRRLGRHLRCRLR